LSAKTLTKLLIPVAAVLLGVVTASLLIALTGVSPLETFGVLASSGFGATGRVWPIFMTLSRATPLILTGLAAMIAFRVGVFCIAQEGQFIFGAIAAAWIGACFKLPPFVHPAVVIVVAMLAGGLYGLIPAFLKVKLGVNEIISSIMLNSIAALFLEYVVAFPLRADAGAKAQSAIVEKTIWIPQFIQGSNWGWAFVVAILTALFLFFYIWRTSSGYELRMVGQAREFARYGGINADRTVLRSLFLSGAVAGLAGCFEVMGVHHRIMTGFSSGLGFDGLSVALLGQSHPLGVVIVAILLAGIRIGAQLGLQIRLGVPRELGGTIIALIIFFLAVEQAYAPWIGKGVEALMRGFKARVARAMAKGGRE